MLSRGRESKRPYVAMLYEKWQNSTPFMVLTLPWKQSSSPDVKRKGAPGLRTRYISVKSASTIVLRIARGQHGAGIDYSIIPVLDGQGGAPTQPNVAD